MLWLSLIVLFAFFVAAVVAWLQAENDVEFWHRCRDIWHNAAKQVAEQARKLEEERDQYKHYYNTVSDKYFAEAGELDREIKALTTSRDMLAASRADQAAKIDRYETETIPGLIAEIARRNADIEKHKKDAEYWQKAYWQLNDGFTLAGEKCLQIEKENQRLNDWLRQSEDHWYRKGWNAAVEHQGGASSEWNSKAPWHAA